MSGRDPPRFPTHDISQSARPVNVNMRRSYNPATGQLQPPRSPQMSEMNQPAPYDLERKLNNLEREHGAMRSEIDGLKKLCSSLQASNETLRKDGLCVEIGPFSSPDAEAFRKKLEISSAESQSILHRANAGNRANGHAMLDGAQDTRSNTSISVPPHLRGRTAITDTDDNKPNIFTPEAQSSANNPLVTDGVVEARPNLARGTNLTPPESPVDHVHPEDPIPSMGSLNLESTTSKAWVPHYLTTLAPLKPDIFDRIPSANMMQSFSKDFLFNTFDGIEWSPGLKFIPPSHGSCMLPNRSYYLVEAQYDPYLPSQPGLHGAKLVPFFNDNVEDHYRLPEGFPSTTENVPLFVKRPDGIGRMRYYYFGHYSQSRWSDRLDYERMQQCVPAKVREYWATELASPGRPEWVTKALLKHLFSKPEYEGRLFGKPIQEGGSIMSDDVPIREEQVQKDVTKYVDQLRDWDKDMRMRAALIKEHIILDQFIRADADFPPGLRLWWEYLECVDWRMDFYNMLVQLQARNPNYERH